MSTREAPGRLGSLPEPARRVAQWFADTPVAIAVVIAVALVVLGEIISPGFASYGQIVSLLRVSAFLGIIAMGQTIVIISGGEGIDLSVGKVATFSAIIAARTIEGDNSQVLAGLSLALLVCAGIGLVNGVGIAYARIPPLVMTLGMIGVVQGLILIYTGGTAAGRAAPAMITLVKGNTILSIPGLLWIWVVLGTLVALVLRRTTFGWRVYALGANRHAAELSGITVKYNVVAVYVCSSMLAALGGFFLLGFTETVFLNLADQYMLPSIAAVVIGGTTLAGGVGGYPGTAVGAVVLTVLESLLTTIRMDAAQRQIVLGVVLIILLSAYGRQRRLRQ